MEEKEFATLLSRTSVVRKPDWQGASCLPRKKSKIPGQQFAVGGGGTTRASGASAVAATSAVDLNFWERLRKYSVSKGLTVKDSAKLVQAAKEIYEADRMGSAEGRVD